MVSCSYVLQTPQTVEALHSAQESTHQRHHRCGGQGGSPSRYQSAVPGHPDQSSQVRGTSGELLDAEQKLQCLEQHFRPIFQAADVHLVPSSCPPTLLTEDELVQQLSQTKCYKAVSATSLPAMLVKALAPSLGGWLHRFLHEHWRTAPCIPPEWKNASLALLHKRPVVTPGDLRPIALTCGIGKAVLGGYVQRLKQCAQ